MPALSLLAALMLSQVAAPEPNRRAHHCELGQMNHLDAKALDEEFFKEWQAQSAKQPCLGARIRVGEAETPKVSALFHSLIGLTVVGPGDDKPVDLSFLRELKALQQLELYGMTLRSLSPLAALRELQYLDANQVRAAGPVDLSFAAHTQLRSLSLHFLGKGEGPTSIKPLLGLHGMETIELCCMVVPDSPQLGALTGLRVLKLPPHDEGSAHASGFDALKFKTTGGDVSFLKSLEHLQTLDLQGWGVTDLTPIANLKELQSLNLSFNRALQDIRPLGELKKLAQLDLAGTQVADISVLNGLPALYHLVFSGLESEGMRRALLDARPGWTCHRTVCDRKWW